MRFDSAREAGLTEAKAAGIEDGFETRFSPREIAALRLTDALIGDARRLEEAERTALSEHFTDAELAELAMGVGLFLGMSKVLISLGLEPQAMPTTVMATPGSG